MSDEIDRIIADALEGSAFEEWHKRGTCCCQYCGEPVGYIGRFLGWLFGLREHGCDFRNLVSPVEDDEGR